MPRTSKGARRRSRRGDMTERLILLPLKLAERPHRRQELASLFRVSPKTISRDITMLSPHYPITEERAGREVIYGFRDGYKYTAPAFTPTELATLLLAQQSIAATGLTSFGTPFAGYGQSLLQKVRAALPPSLRAKLDALATIFGTAQVPAKDYSGHAETIDQLTTAAVECRRLRMRYHTLHRNEISEREFEPYAVYFDPDGATLKVIGFDHRSGETRPFSVDHIRDLRQTGEVFQRPEDFDLNEYLARNCFNGIHGEPMTVRLRAYGVTARVFAERMFHPSQRIIEQVEKGEGRQESTTIEMTVARGRGLVRFILSWAPDIEVLDPPELQGEVDDALRMALSRPGENKISVLQNRAPYLSP